MRYLGRRILLLTAGIGCLSSSAFADDPLGFYLGAGIGESEVRRESYFFDEHHFAWEAFTGIRPIHFAGVELQYLDFGDPHAGPNYNFASANSDAKAVSLLGVGYLPLSVPFLDIYGKLGVARLHSKTSEQIPGLCPPGAFCPLDFIAERHQDQWSTDLAYGGGAQAKFGAIAVRTEYERISVSGGSPDMFTFGVTWTF